jgi:hypothetical protein
MVAELERTGHLQAALDVAEERTLTAEVRTLAASLKEN